MYSAEENELWYDNNSTIHGFSWITPWDVEAINKFQYLELDITFSLLHPYVLMVPQIIVNGLSLPLGILIEAKENKY